MKFRQPQLAHETMLDMVVIGKSGQIWLQQDKKYRSDWTLIKRMAPNDDAFGHAYEELTKLGFITREVTMVREGAIFWNYEGQPRRTRHLLLSAEVNYAEPPTETSTQYLAAFPYEEAMVIQQHYYDDLKQLDDPAVAAMTRRPTH